MTTKSDPECARVALRFARLLAARDYDGAHAETAVAIRDRARSYRARMDDPAAFAAPLRQAFERYFLTEGVDGMLHRLLLTRLETE